MGSKTIGDTATTPLWLPIRFHPHQSMSQDSLLLGRWLGEVLRMRDKSRVARNDVSILTVRREFAESSQPPSAATLDDGWSCSTLVIEE